MRYEALHESLARTGLSSNNDIAFHTLLEHLELIGANFEYLLPPEATILGNLRLRTHQVEFEVCHHKPVVDNASPSL